MPWASDWQVCVDVSRGFIGPRSGHEHGRPFEPPLAQIVERLIGPGERIGRGRRLDLRVSRDVQEFAAVGAGQMTEAMLRSSQRSR